MNRMICALVVCFFGLASSEEAEGKAPNWGYSDTPKLPSGWCVHDIDRPQPKVVTPAATVGQPPSDAIVLFDGVDASAWQGTKQDNPKSKKFNPEAEMRWKVENGTLECTPTGAIRTKQKFGDCQFHIEWQTANPRKGHSQESGNSGVFMQARYETQVLDNYENRTYADGMAGCVYGQQPPLVNACKKPGEWQVYDIIFQAPRFDGEKLVSPAYVTVFLNGVLLHHKQELLGPTTHKKLPVYKPHGDDVIVLQDHNNDTRFRNIWIRELDLTRTDHKTK
jgi:hypothetical protein